MIWAGLAIFKRGMALSGHPPLISDGGPLKKWIKRALFFSD
jgi:hypothetical protein